MYAYVWCVWILRASTCVCLYACTHIVRPVVKVLDASSIIGRVALRIFGDGRSTKHLHCVLLTGTLTYIYNTVRPLITEDTLTTSTIQSDPITEDTLTKHLYCVPLTGTLTHIYNTVRPHHRGHSHNIYNTVRPHQRGHSHSTSKIQSDPITEDTLTTSTIQSDPPHRGHSHNIYNTVRPYHRGHSHNIYNTVRLHHRRHSHSTSALCSPGWHSHSTSKIQSDPITEDTLTQHLKYSQTPSQRILSQHLQYSQTPFTEDTLTTSTIQSDPTTEDTLTTSTIQSDSITEDTLTQHLHCVPLTGTLTQHLKYSQTPSQRTLSQHLQYSQTPSQKRLSLNISSVFPWLALSLTSTIQSDPITEDTLTKHLYCVPLTGTLTHIYNTVRPHHKGHSHSTPPLCFPGWHSHSHLQYSQTPSQRTLSQHLQYSQTPSQRTLSLTSTIQSDPITEDTTQSDPITEDTLTKHLYCVPLAGTFTHIYNTVRPHHRGHSHNIYNTVRPHHRGHSHNIYNTVRPHHRGHSHNI